MENGDFLSGRNGGEKSDVESQKIKMKRLFFKQIETGVAAKENKSKG